jgi:hypothetical protein
LLKPYLQFRIMQKILYLLFSLIALSACRQNQEGNIKKEKLTFKIFLNPSFDESAEITLLKNGEDQNISFLICTRIVGKDIIPAEGNLDTFYHKSISISNNQYRIFDSLVIQKTKIKQPHQWSGCCDGMPVSYMSIKDLDTTILYFRSPNIVEPDSSGYRITKDAIEQLSLLYEDTVIREYLLDIESYMDDSKFHRADPKRIIDQMRMKKYNLRISEQ